MYQQSLSPQRVLDYIDRQASTPELEVLRLVAMTGLHPQALLGLRPTDVDPVHREVTCSFKGRRGALPMSHAVLDTLGKLNVDQDFFFARAGQPVELREVIEHWEALCIAEGLRDENGRTPGIATLRSAALARFAADLKRERG
mgnify:CR=1 FL=1